MREDLETSSLREMLEHAEGLFGSLADATGIVWWARDLRSGRMMYVSPGFEALWEQPCEDLYKRPDAWVDRIHHEDRPRVSAKFRAITQTGQADEIFRLVLPSGKRRWIRDRGLVMHHGTEMTHVAGLAEDITEARNAQIRLAVQHMVVKILAEVGARDDAFPRVIEAMADPLEWTTAALWLVNPECNRLECASFWRQSASEPRPIDDPAHPTPLAPGESLAGRAWQSGEPVFDFALTGDAYYRRMAASVPGLKTGAAFPILVGDKVLGVLDFAGVDTGIPEAELVRTLTALARQIGLWLERCRVDEEARQETRKLRIVNRALSTYVASMSSQRAADEMLGGALELTESTAGFLGVVVGGETMRVLAQSGLHWETMLDSAFHERSRAAADAAGYLDLPAGHNPFDLVISGRATVMVNAPAHGAGARPPGHPAFTAFLGVPIEHDGTVVGMFGVANRAGGYDRRQRGELEALAALAGVLCQRYRTLAVATA